MPDRRVRRPATVEFVSIRTAVARIPGAKWLAGRLGMRPSLRGYDDSPQTLADVAELVALIVRNRFSRRSAVDAASSVVVSMTTYGQRVRRVHVALESIARGTTRPGRLILWLDDASVVPTSALRRLERRGLEIITVESGLRVHTKYFPYARSTGHHQVPMVTSDDDIIYPPHWLAGLLEAAGREPGAIVCYRAHRIAFDGDSLLPYREWRPTTSSEASPLNFGTSVSGQLFPARLLDLLRDRGEAFRNVSPMNDDIWVHWVAITNAIPVAQVSAETQHFTLVPGTQSSGLFITNMWGGENDEQFAATYAPSDLLALRAAR